MKKIVLGLSSILFILIFTNRVSAQKQWSLRECIEYAYENNLQIKQAVFASQISKNSLIQSKAEIFPNLNVGASQSYSYGNSVDPFTQEFIENNFKSTNIGLSSSVNLFKGFQQANTIAQNKLNLQAGLQDVERLKNDISLNIASAYLQILFNYEIVEISKNQVETTQKQVERTKKLVEAGSLARGNLLEIESQFAQDELQLTNSENQLETSYLNLTQLLDIDSVGNFVIQRPVLAETIDVEDITLTVNDIYNKAFETLPQIKKQEYLLQSSEKGLKIAQGYLMPNLSLNATYGTGYTDARMRQLLGDPVVTEIGRTASNEAVYAAYPTSTLEKYPFKDQFNDNKSLSLSLRLNIPIFNRFQVKTAMDNAKINVLQSKTEFQLVSNQLYKDIQQAYLNATSALKKYKSSVKTVESTFEAFRYAEQKYEVGNVTLVDYAIAKNNLLRARSDNLQAKYEYIFSMKILDFYRGIDLAF
ncbi:MAG: TolC family protein [Chlorobi bacterium]|nr:TolC family protein [Chlorobiota bacterium]